MLSDTDIALIILAGYPKPEQCASCEHYARRRPPGKEHHGYGALCVCCYQKKSKPYLFNCDGSINLDNV